MLTVITYRYILSLKTLSGCFRIVQNLLCSKIKGKCTVNAFINSVKIYIYILRYRYNKELYSTKYSTKHWAVCFVLQSKTKSSLFGGPSMWKYFCNIFSWSCRLYSWYMPERVGIARTVLLYAFRKKNIPRFACL